MLSIALLLTLSAQSAAPRLDPPAASECSTCAPDSWQFRHGKWFWWTGTGFTYFWHAGAAVRVRGAPRNSPKPTKAPQLKLQIKPGPNVFPHRPQ